MSSYVSKLFRFILISTGIVLMFWNCEKESSESKINHSASFIQNTKNVYSGSNLEMLELQENLKNLESQRKIIGKTIVVDTLLTGIIERDSKYYIRTYREFQFSKRFYMFLECEKSVIDKIRTFESYQVLVRANIFRIDKSYTYKIITTIDKTNEYVYLEDEYYLFGKCIGIVNSNPQS